MNDLTYRTLSAFPEPGFSLLSREVFADDEPSQALTDALDQEAAARSHHLPGADADAVRIGCFRAETLVGWTYARAAGSSQLDMVNSGVALAERRQGIYTELAKRVLEHAHAQGYAVIASRHVASNSAVIIAKLKLGFIVSGFEYSEVYGPLVRLCYVVGDLRRALYQSRVRPIRRIDEHDA